VLAAVLTLGNFPGRPEQTHQPDSARPQLQPLAMPSPFAPLRGRLTLSAPVQRGRRRLFCPPLRLRLSALPAGGGGVITRRRTASSAYPRHNSGDVQHS
jgi:hypothetical protein